MQGRLGHQMLGQLLILGSTDLEVAGANLVVAATARQRNALAQVALRTAAPALAVHSIFRKTEARLEGRERRLNARDTVRQAKQARLAAPQADIEAAAAAQGPANAAEVADLQAKLAL